MPNYFQMIITAQCGHKVVVDHHGAVVKWCKKCADENSRRSPTPNEAELAAESAAQLAEDLEDYQSERIAGLYG